MNPHAHPATSDVQTVKMIHDVIRDSFILVFSIADDLHSCFDRFMAQNCTMIFECALWAPFWGLLCGRFVAEQERLRLARWHNCLGCLAAMVPNACRNVQRLAMEKLAAQVIALSVQVFVFAGQATKDKTDKTDTKPIGSGQAVNRL